MLGRGAILLPCFICQLIFYCNAGSLIPKMLKGDSPSRRKGTVPFQREGLSPFNTFGKTEGPELCMHRCSGPEKHSHMKHARCFILQGEGSLVQWQAPHW